MSDELCPEHRFTRFNQMLTCFEVEAGHEGRPPEYLMFPPFHISASQWEHPFASPWH